MLGDPWKPESQGNPFLTLAGPVLHGRALLRRDGLRIGKGDNVHHDGVQLKIFGRIDTGHAHFLEAQGVVIRDDAADDDRSIAQASGAHTFHQVLDQWQV